MTPTEWAEALRAYVPESDDPLSSPLPDHVISRLYTLLDGQELTYADGIVLRDIMISIVAFTDTLVAHFTTLVGVDKAEASVHARHTLTRIAAEPGKNEWLNTDGWPSAAGVTLHYQDLDDTIKVPITSNGAKTMREFYPTLLRDLTA